ncbi:response regulator transcription factor [Rhodovastum atsumiense]|uniref:Response regulator transcription factor n=2 Tax=Rhodovastum atsumiense TaxID=504468 RepID=A0A5M6ISI6_9PROT|nr:response regulator transcription factor [Rhodovastum atsumiense]
MHDHRTSMTAEPSPPLLMPRVLLIEDNAAVAETIRRFLERSGMRTAWAPTGARGMELKKSFSPDVVLVDLELPDTNGVSLIGWLSQEQDCGIIVVSGRAEETERVVGLELGADDYIAKPVQMREMVARIRAVHRRTHGRGPARAARPSSVHQVGPFRIDLQRRSVTDAEDRPVVLTGAEFAALQTLVEAIGEPVSRERLSEAALRRPWRPEDRSIDQLIFSLRRKLADDDRGQRLIQSVRGAGYVLVSDPGPACADG